MLNGIPVVSSNLSCFEGEGENQGIAEVVVCRNVISLEEIRSGEMEMLTHFGNNLLLTCYSDCLGLPRW